ncbi:hypothetical protein RO3G_14782 [Rhizopus delemar RA 99-880]|uniref:Uncharacterized protein n=1 Tax=Rhizopus delemar (strain RA 99-880 / ATCC MYA-4621 / FGSC 9543 / NRRL 43880) TaxID=246409 RepID=I1CNP1_RHIO9|nr:hypothetical protein RO3G_14782 [Rhizopus delemar RA 99-880]|eukprot:EIE90071.1 hypothetical protein RO3G_14782 [Rhizopus delemar RA 99-880]
MHLETEQTSDLDQEVISINNDDNEELLEIEAFEVDDEAHNTKDRSRRSLASIKLRSA